MHFVEKGLSQAAGRRSKVKVSLARRHLKGDPTRSILFVEQDALLDDTALHQQGSLIDGTRVYWAKIASSLNVSLNSQF
jgi:hypothetical protein